MMSFEKESIITVMKNGGGEGVGTQQGFIRGGTARRPSRPLPFYMPF